MERQLVYTLHSAAHLADRLGHESLHRQIDALAYSTALAPPRTRFPGE